jgi:hypothetical protein
LNEAYLITITLLAWIVSYPKPLLILVGDLRLTFLRVKEEDPASCFLAHVYGMYTIQV